MEGWEDVPPDAGFGGSYHIPVIGTDHRCPWPPPQWRLVTGQRVKSKGGRHHLAA